MCHHYRIADREPLWEPEEEPTAERERPETEREEKEREEREPLAPPADD